MSLTRRQKRDLASARNDLRALLGEPAFRRFAIRLLGEAGLNAANPALNPMVEGRRMVGNWLVDQMNQIDVTLYPALLLDAAQAIRNQPLADDEELTDE